MIQEDIDRKQAQLAELRQQRAYFTALVHYMGYEPTNDRLSTIKRELRQTRQELCALRSLATSAEAN